MYPYTKQETDFYCGPAVVQMILARIGIIFTQQQLALEMGTTPEVGTTAEALVDLLELHGLTATRTNDATVSNITDALARGDYAIVGYIEQGGDPHYALVTTCTNDTITLADPLFGDQYPLSLSDFETRWHDIEPSVYGNRLLITVA